MLIDTHAHLDFRDFKRDQAAVIARATTAGVGTIINVGADMKGSRESARLADEYENIFSTAGIHPHDANEATEENLAELRALAMHPKCCSVGEIGLDYFRSRTAPAVQKAAFIKQMDIAAELSKPVIVHTRDAEDDVLEILGRYPGVPGVIHFFSGSPEFAKKVVDMGLYVSFTGVITFRPRAPGSGSGAEYDNLRGEIINSIPLDRLMVETDCPFAAPEPHRGKRNEPAFVVDIARKLAEFRGITFEEISSATTTNAHRFFNI